MKKGWKITLIAIASVLVLAALLSAGIYICWRLEETTDPEPVRPVVQGEPDELVDVTWTVSGDMNGGHYVIELWLTGEDEATLEISDQDAWNFPDQKSRFICPRDSLRKVSDLIEQYGMRTWLDDPEEEVDILDGNTSYLSLRYGSGDCWSISGMMFPEGRRDALREVTGLLLSFRKNENSPLRLGTVPVNEDGKLTIWSLADGYAEVSLENRGSRVKKTSDAFRLEKKEGSGWKKLKQVKKAEEKQTFEVAAGDSMPLQVDLNLYGKLEPGEYRLTLGGEKCEFCLTEEGSK